MKLDELKKLVRAEATALVANTTKAERKRLNFEKLNPVYHTECIYGQMTGSCFTEKAHKLITKCAPKLINGEIGGDITPVANRKVIKGNMRKDEDNKTYWSPIEVFIATQSNKKGNIDSLVKFLKGESKTLRFK